MEEYAIRRREYVQQVRASFDELENAEDSLINGDRIGHFRSDEEEYENEMMQSPFIGFKIRLFCAVMLFLAFAFCKYHSYEIFTRNPVEIIDMISDNQYYTILQKYVRM